MTKNVSAWLHFNENCEDFILECYNHSIMNKTSVTVFSTESGRHCPNCGMPVSECACKPAGANSPQWKDDVIRVRREKQGRNGKEVTTVRNFPGTTDELRRHATALKRRSEPAEARKTERSKSRAITSITSSLISKIQA